MYAVVWIDVARWISKWPMELETDDMLTACTTAACLSDGMSTFAQAQTVYVLHRNQVNDPYELMTSYTRGSLNKPHQRFD